MAEQLLVLLTWRHLVCTYVLFQTHITPRPVAQIFVAGGSVVAGLHVAWSLWLLFNVFWNQMHCTFSSPGTTLEVNEQVGSAGSVWGMVDRAPGLGTWLAQRKRLTQDGSVAINNACFH